MKPRKGGLDGLMKQAAQMQERMAALSEELAGREVEARSGGGMVRAVVNGRHELRALEIDPQVIDPSDPGMLEDLILTAVNDAHRRAEELVRTEMGKATGGLGIPGLPGLL